MSATIGTSSKRTTKSACRKCNRTVYLVDVGDGKLVATDPELINVIPFEADATPLLARRVHAEMCVRYMSETERLKAQQAAKRAANPGAKRAPTQTNISGPGQGAKRKTLR